MIQIVNGQAQLHYNGSWEQIAHDLEVLYPTENYTSINAYGLIFEINDIMDVIAAADYIVNNFFSLPCLFVSRSFVSFRS